MLDLFSSPSSSYIATRHGSPPLSFLSIACALASCQRSSVADDDIGKKKAAFIEKKDFPLDFRPPPLLRPYGRDNRNERNKGPPLEGSLRVYSRVSLSLSLQSNAPQRLRNGGSNSINQHIYRRPIVRNSSKVETTLRLIIDEEPFRVAGHVSV